MVLPTSFLVSLGLAVASLDLFCVGYSSTVWFDNYGGVPKSVGLWKVCNTDTGECGSIQDIDSFAELHVARVLCTMALILAIVNLVFITLFGFRPVKMYASVALTSILSAGILNFFGPVAFVSVAYNIEADIGWGAVLTFISGIIQIIASILIIIPMSQGSVGSRGETDNTDHALLAYLLV